MSTKSQVVSPTNGPTNEQIFKYLLLLMYYELLIYTVNLTLLTLTLLI